MAQPCDRLSKHFTFGQLTTTSSGLSNQPVSSQVLASQHVRGEAVDFPVSGHSVYEVAMWISETIDYDQLILENFLPGIPISGWVHCSFARNNRGQDLTKFKGSKTYYPGIILKPE